MSDTSQIQKIDLNKTDWRSSREFFQSLEDELRNLDDKDEKYDFTWVGKRKAIIEAGAPINKTLRPDVKSSKNWDTTQNLFIEGDNLDALKLLQESYLGKVKMIYIDPPYNTGKDFVYHDNFKANVEQYDEDTEYKDEEGNIQFKKNEKSNGRYHSDWLSMMYPRLKLARNLLSDDGVIFISIDDNEHANLKRLCDEVFGEDSYLTTLNIQVRYADKSLNEEKAFKPLIEYVLIYAKDDRKFSPSRPEEEYTSDKFIYEVIELGTGSEIDINGQKVTVFYKDNWKLIKHEKGDKSLLKETWISGSIYATMSYGKVYKKVVEPRYKNDGLGSLYKVHGRGDDGLGYRYYTAPQKNNATRGKMYSGMPLSRVEEINSEKGAVRYAPIPNFYDYSPDFGNIKHEGGISFNSGKKPIKLLIQLMNFVKSKDYIVLDFFAGSSSTAHATMQLNAKDGGKRKWIMVQLPEIIDKNNDTDNLEFTTISEISRERIRRAGDKIAKEDPDAKVDYGFRSLVIADTNFKEVYKPVSEISQESLLDTVDNIKEDRSELDLLYGVLTQLALELNRPLETREIVGSKVYLYDYLGEVSGLAACFSTSVSEEAIKHIAELKPLTAVFRDSSFADSQAKVNLAEHFRIISPDTKVRVI